MLAFLFGSRTVERVLFYVLRNETCYASELSRRFWSALSPVQRALERLEGGGVLRGELIGRRRTYRFNPDYPHLAKLKELLSDAYQSLPDEMRRHFYEPSLETSTAP